LGEEMMRGMAKGQEGDGRGGERGWVKAGSNSVKKGAGRGKCKI